MTQAYTSRQDIEIALTYLYYLHSTAVAIAQITPGMDSFSIATPEPLEPYLLLLDDEGDNQPFLCIFKRNNELIIAFPGYNYNKWGVSNVMALATDPSSYYSIPCFVARNLARFNEDLQTCLREILIEFPEIDSINIVGHSYGGALTPVVGLIYEHIIAYHKGNYRTKIGDTSLVTHFSELIYNTYLSNDVINCIKLQKTPTRFVELVQQDLQARNIVNHTHQDIVESVFNMDKLLFSRLRIKDVYSFAGPSVLSADMYDYYNNFSADKLSGDQSGSTLFERTYNYYLSNDPIAGLLNSRAPLGRIISIFNRFISRFTVGKIVLLSNNGTFGMHQYTDYIDFLLKAYNNGQTSFGVYDGKTSPIDYFPVTKSILLLPNIYTTYGLWMSIIFVIVYIVVETIILLGAFCITRLMWYLIKMALGSGLSWGGFLNITYWW